jgi:hypothetical protein
VTQDKATLDKIKKSARDFDLNSAPGEDDAEMYLDMIGGNSDVCDEQEADAGMPLAEAASIIEGAESPTFKYFLNDIVEFTQRQYVARSKDLKKTSDWRVTHQNMALGLEHVLDIWKTKLAEAVERVQRATPEERRRMNATVKRVIEVGPSSTESKTDGFYSSDGHPVTTLQGMNVVAAEYIPRRR